MCSVYLSESSKCLQDEEADANSRSEGEEAPPAVFMGAMAETSRVGSNFLAIRNGLEVPAFAGIEREGAEYCSMNLGFHATYSPVRLCFLTPSCCWSDSIKQIHDPYSSEVYSVVDAVIYSVSGTAVPAGNSGNIWM